MESPMSENKVSIMIQPTPNPNALKFILEQPLKKEGYSTYRSPMDCPDNRLALEIFKIRGVDQIHLFDNTVTVTKFGYEEWDNVEPQVTETLQREVPHHNPEYFDPDPEKERRENLAPELQEIEHILDRTIRPGLQADGGDIQAVSYEDKVLLIRYQGACGTCPSSTTGTLEAIKGILRNEYDQDLDVFIAPDY